MSGGTQNGRQAAVHYYWVKLGVECGGNIIIIIIIIISSFSIKTIFIVGAV